MTAVLGEKGVRKFAEIEHGRWNVERLSYGWRYAEEKDVLKKTLAIPCALERSAAQNPGIRPGCRPRPAEEIREAGLELYQL